MISFSSSYFCIDEFQSDVYWEYLFHNQFLMQPQVILQIDKSVEYDREVIERLVSESMGKVDSYLKKYDDKPDAELRIELTIGKNADDSFYGKLHAHLDGELYIFDREKYIKLDDLIRHAFQHIKEQLSSK